MVRDGKTWFVETEETSRTEHGRRADVNNRRELRRDAGLARKDEMLGRRSRPAWTRRGYGDETRPGEVRKVPGKPGVARGY